MFPPSQIIVKMRVELMHEIMDCHNFRESHNYFRFE
jgi:hypothetical protein